MEIWVVGRGVAWLYISEIVPFCYQSLNIHDSHLYRNKIIIFFLVMGLWD